MTKKMLAVAALAGVAVLAGCGTQTEEVVVTGDVNTGVEVVETMTGAEEVLSGEAVEVSGTTETAEIATGDFVVEASAE
jgi:lipoprotein